MLGGYPSANPEPRKLRFAGSGFGLRSDGDRQGEQIDEAFGVFRIVPTHGETGEVGAVQRVGGKALGDVEGAFPKLEADRASDALLGDVEEAVKGFAKRREP